MNVVRTTHKILLAAVSVIAVGAVVIVATRKQTNTISADQLPAELAFLTSLDSTPDHKTWTESRYPYGRSGWTREYDMLQFNVCKLPQEIAREMKQALTSERGWQIQFPDVGSYNGSATRAINDKEDWRVDWDSASPEMAYTAVLVVNRSRPLRSGPSSLP